MSNAFSMVAPHAKGKVARDVIFAAGRRAAEAVATHGRAAVVNATIGTFLGDDETLACLPTVFSVLKNLPDVDFAAYSPFQGDPHFLKAITEMVMGDYRPDALIAPLATPGSTGAIRNAFWNYMAEGDAALVPDWHWAAYSTIAEEHGRQVHYYPTFDEDGAYSVDGMRVAVRDHLKTQGRALVVVNDPGHNPTGYDMTDEDWSQVMDLLREEAKSGQPITLLVDVPYIDYAAEGEAARRFMRRFTQLPDNLLVIIAASVSKSMTLYGLRTGAMIGVSSNAQVLKEFEEVNAHSARGVWTNVPRAGMQVVTRIWNDATLRAAMLSERDGFRNTLARRAKIFIPETQQAGLAIMPYRSGYFVSIPCPNPAALAEHLWEDNIYVVPMEKGIRFAISAVPEHKLPGVASKIEVAMKALGQG